MEFKLGNYVPSLLFFFALELALVALVLGLDLPWWGFALASFVLFTAWLLWVNRKRMEPMYVILVGLGGFMLFGVVAMVGIVMWMNKATTPTAQMNDLVADIEAIKSDLNKYVLPRKLSDEQLNLIEDFLLKRDKNRLHVVVPKDNNEAHSYGRRLFNAFKQGEWNVTFEKRDNVMDGLSLKVKHPLERSGKVDEIAEIIRRAFELAGVELSSSGGGLDRDAQEPYAVLYVGRKKRL